MTCADQFMTAAFRNGGAQRAARDIDPACEKDEDANMQFFHFSDGSVVGVKGRGKNHQRWIVRQRPIEMT